MKSVLYPLPLILSASTALGHESTFTHAHLNDPNWLPLLAGMLTIAAAATLLWLRK